MSDINYLLIGTTTADLIDNRRILGGTVSYSASIVHRFGHNVRILSSGIQDEPLHKPLHDVAVYTSFHQSILLLSRTFTLIQGVSRLFTIHLLT